jgi:hypothetical protein
VLLKAVRQPLGTCGKGIGKLLGNAQRLLESLWAILKGYRKLLGNDQISVVSQQERR